MSEKMYSRLDLHREELCAWFNANGHEASIYNAFICDTLIVDENQVWNEVAGSWASWFLDQLTDHSYRDDWAFRISCEFLIEDHDWEKQAKHILNLIEMQPAFERLQNGYLL